MTDVTGSAGPRQDYDLFSEDYVRDPATYWARFRSECPVAGSDLYGGSHMPVRYEDIVSVARDVESFTSSQGVSVIQVLDRKEALKEGTPPIDADPPLHNWTRRLMLPPMSPKAVQSYEQGTRDLCRRLIAGFIDEGRAARWPGGYEQWLLDRRTRATRGSVATTAAPTKKPPKDRSSDGRSHSTIRHELKTTEKAMDRLQKQRDRLDVELATDGENRISNRLHR